MKRFRAFSTVFAGYGVNALKRSIGATTRRLWGNGVQALKFIGWSAVALLLGASPAFAQAAADFLLLNDSLNVVAQGVEGARRMQTVIRQNLYWALLYNLAAIPLAALGLVQPWLAAIGMSASSLFVVLNARRLARAAR